MTIKTLTHDGLIETAIKAGESYKLAEEKEMEGLNRIEDMIKGNIKDLGNIKGKLEFGELTWENGKAKVIINKITEEDYIIEYKVLDQNNNIVQDYTKIESGDQIVELSLGSLVIVRLTDGKNYTINTATLEVKDETGPTVNAATGVITINSIAIQNVTAVDNEVGMPANTQYKYYIKKSTEENYPEVASYTGQDTSYNFTGLARDTSYDIKITAQDSVGNLGTKYITEIKTNPNTSPELVTDSVKLTRTASGMTIEAVGTDRDNDDITYTLEWGANTGYGKTKTAKVGSGEKVTITFDNVAKTDNVYWKITGSDGIGVTESKIGSSVYCNGYVAAKRTCTVCNGTLADCQSCGRSRRRNM